MAEGTDFFKYIHPRIEKLIKDKMNEDGIEFDGEIYTWDNIRRPLSSNNYCVYQTENLYLDHKRTPHYIRFLNGAKYVFDYSMKNIPYYPRGIYLPLKLETIPEKNNIINNEILFYGYLSDRRNNLINLLRQNNISIKTVDGHFGEKLFNLLSQYQYILSYGTYDNFSNDSFRVLPAIENGCTVFFERTEETEFDEYLLKRCPDRIIPFEEKNIIDVINRHIK